jgi:ketosteroid isomerase-like protein
MNDTLVNVVKDMYAAFSRGDIDAILNRLHDDVEWEHDAEDHGIPWLKPGRGKPHVAGFFSNLGAVELPRFELVSCLASEHQVVALFHIELRVKASGRAVRDFEAHLWTFDDSGKVTKFRHFVDTSQHESAARV